MTLVDALKQQAQSCASLGSPFMERLLNGLAANWPHGSQIDTFFATFDGDPSSYGASLPLRLAGGLHALVLTGRDPALAACYPPHEVEDAALIAAVRTAIKAHADFLVTWCQTAPQTNEVRRSVALIPAGRLLAARFACPLRLSELGASGGLNLMWDRFALDLDGVLMGPDDAGVLLRPELRGDLPQGSTPVVIDRRGVDLNPLDPRDPDDALRLRAYLWPDQPHRMELTERAIAIQDAPVDRADAIDWLAHRLTEPSPGVLHLIYHTIAWQYFPKDAQDRGTALIEAAGARATDETPLAWLSMEADGQDAGAALVLRIWPGNETVVLGRADFHGRWIKWDPRPA